MKIADKYAARLGTAKFRHPPPQFENVRPAHMQEVKPPYSGAPGWQCSVYYFWYEYLRRHDGYRATCQANGVGDCAQQFTIFGNVHALGFADWWGQYFVLFEERRPLRRLKQMPALDQHGYPVDPSQLFLEIDLTAPFADLIKQFREEVWLQKRAAEDRIERGQKARATRRGQPIPQRPDLDETKSTALYPVATRPMLFTLHQHLKVWDAHLVHTDVSDAELADYAGIAVNEIVNGETVEALKRADLPYRDLERVIRRRKQLVVQRHLRIANQYMDNVVNGEFPKRSTR